MARTFGQTSQDVQESSLSVLGKAARTTTESILSGIDQQSDLPLRLSATFPTADSKLNISASATIASDGASKALPPAQALAPSFSASTIDFQSGATTGGTISITLPSTTVGQYRRCAFTYLPSGTLKATFSAASATVGGLADPGTLVDNTGVAVGYIDLEATAATAFKTAGSLSSIVENSVSGTSRIFRFTGTGMAGMALTVQTGGTPVDTATKTINFTGATVTDTSPGVVHVDFSGAGFDVNTILVDASGNVVTQNGNVLVNS